MHHIYRTRAFVIKSFETKEADKELILLTNDFGLIKVKAQGIRKITSKLKYSLQDFSLADVALVRGKNGYRLTNAKADINLFYEIKDIEIIKMISRVFSLIYKLVHGEDNASKLFIILEKFIALVINQKNLDHKKLEIITVSNILFCLGYFEKEHPLTNEYISKFTQTESEALIKEINSSIKATQL